MSGEAIVCRLKHVRKHPDADRLQVAYAAGNQIITGLKECEGDLGIFFDSDTQLLHEYCMENHLYRKHPETGEKMGGLLEKNRRVRAVRLRGKVSYGLWMPIESLESFGVVSTLKEGETFTDFNGFRLCQKYITPATRAANLQAARKRPRRGQTEFFRQHYNTEQLYKFFGDIPTDSFIVITEKLHGTSHRFGLVPDVIIPKWFGHKLMQKLGLSPEMDWSYLSGTRRVIINDGYTGYYDDESFREEMCEFIKPYMRRGEIFYFEIVGYAGDTPIMSPQDTARLPEIQEKYGDTMIYNYRCHPGVCMPYVYRIEYVDMKGYRIEYPWWLVKKRCQESGIPHVPELWTFVYRDADTVKGLAEHYCNGPSTIDASHMREGVVVRYDSAYGSGAMKHKSWYFYYLEGILKEMPDYVDLEEAS
jgi:hypothetical protein